MKTYYRVLIWILMHLESFFAHRAGRLWFRRIWRKLGYYRNEVQIDANDFLYDGHIYVPKMRKEHVLGSLHYWLNKHCHQTSSVGPSRPPEG